MSHRITVRRAVAAGVTVSVAANILNLFSVDLGQTCAGILALALAAISLLALAAGFLVATFEVSGRRRKTALALAAVLCAATLGLWFTPIRDYSFVWRHARSFEDAIQTGSQSGLPHEPYYWTEGSTLVQFSYSWGMDVYAVLHDPEHKVLDPDSDWREWHEYQLEGLQHLWGPWFVAVY